jgi:methionine biosynthesis protein MetW
LRSFTGGLRLTWRLVFHRPPIGTASTDYDAYWHERLGAGQGELNAFQAFRARWIAKRVKAGARILDVGCGDGGILDYLRREAGALPVGADVSPYVLEILARKGIEAVKLDLNAGGISALPGADHVLLLEVLEHVQNPESLLRDALAKASKSVFFSVPNTGYFPYRLSLLMGRFPVQWRVHPGEHVRYWTLRDMRWWLAELGLKDCSEVAVYRGIPGVNRILPGMFGMGMIVEVRVTRRS